MRDGDERWRWSLVFSSAAFPLQSAVIKVPDDDTRDARLLARLQFGYRNIKRMVKFRRDPCRCGRIAFTSAKTSRARVSAYKSTDP